MNIWMFHFNDLYRCLKLLSCHYLSDGYSIEFFCINGSAQSRNEIVWYDKTDIVNSLIKMQIPEIIKMYLKVTNYHRGSEVFSQVLFYKGNQSLKFVIKSSYFSSFLLFSSGSLMSMFEISLGTLIPGI